MTRATLSDNEMISGSEQRNLKQHDKRILLIEDEVFIQKAHSLVLHSLGLKFDLASTGQEALMLFKKNTYDLVLLDIQLPDILGFEISRQMREKMTDRDLPIIALSGLGLAIKAECVSAGIDEIYAKPMSRQALSDIILTSLGLDSLKVEQ